MGKVARNICIWSLSVVALIGTLLPLFPFLAPVLMFQTKLAMMTVGPTQGSDGPSLFLGPLGSCSRPTNHVGVNCTAASSEPVFDLSFLPAQARLTSAPSWGIIWFLSVGLGVSIFSYIMFVLQLVSFHRKPIRGIGWSIWLNISSFVLTSVPFLMLLLSFHEAVTDFNLAILREGSAGSKLFAKLGHAIPVAVVAYVIQALQLTGSVVLHLIPSKPKKQDGLLWSMMKKWDEK